MGAVGEGDATSEPAGEGDATSKSYFLETPRDEDEYEDGVLTTDQKLTVMTRTVEERENELAKERAQLVLAALEDGLDGVAYDISEAPVADHLIASLRRHYRPDPSSSAFPALAVVVLQCQDSLASAAHALGAEKDDVLAVTLTLAEAYMGLAWWRPALRLLQRLQLGYERTYGRNHVTQAILSARLGRVYSAMGDTKEALVEYEKSAEIFEKMENLEDNMDELREVLNGLGTSLGEANLLKESHAVLMRLLDLYRLEDNTVTANSPAQEFSPDVIAAVGYCPSPDPEANPLWMGRVTSELITAVMVMARSLIGDTTPMLSAAAELQLLHSNHKLAGFEKIRAQGSQDQAATELEAIRLTQSVLNAALLQFGERHALSQAAMMSMARLRRQCGQLRLAEQLYRAACHLAWERLNETMTQAEMESDRRQTIKMMRNMRSRNSHLSIEEVSSTPLSRTSSYTQDLPSLSSYSMYPVPLKDVPLYLQGRREEFGRADVLQWRMEHGQLLRDWGHWESARKLFEEIDAVATSVKGFTTQEHLVTLFELGNALMNLRCLEEAKVVIDKCHELQCQSLGREHLQAHLIRFALAKISHAESGWRHRLNYHALIEETYSLLTSVYHGMRGFGVPFIEPIMQQVTIYYIRFLFERDKFQEATPLVEDLQSHFRELITKERPAFHVGHNQILLKPPPMIRYTDPSVLSIEEQVLLAEVTQCAAFIAEWRQKYREAIVLYREAESVATVARDKLESVLADQHRVLADRQALGDIEVDPTNNLATQTMEALLEKVLEVITNSDSQIEQAEFLLSR